MALTDRGIAKICENLASEAESFSFQVINIGLQGKNTTYGKIAVRFDLSDGANKMSCFLL